MAIIRTHGCGGTIRIKSSATEARTTIEYCDLCHAFRFFDSENLAMPTGTSKAENKKSHDAGYERSPEAGVIVQRDDPIVE